MPKIQKIIYKGKLIIYVDYRGQNEEQMLETASSLRDFLLSNPGEHLRLVNITDTPATRKFTAYIRELGKETKNVPVKGAVVGITGAKKVLLSGYNRLLGGAMRPFNDEETAKEYLVS
ncbi:hypothetical protein SAMN05421640_1814 [Ekhidna lutea]|uniref:SpoIIAA-like n=1 Tax=Ekhidna lutea TaxID=447679 RepID=A0A239ITY8_EKHLU|nr:hypothetical protein [Ekhidna lutea]SNS96688.1 hypothetical protein SAMN05421640_1814 [Ekhidna lutea]